MRYKIYLVLSVVLLFCYSCSKENVEPKDEPTQQVVDKINGISFTANNASLSQPDIVPLQEVNTKYTSLMPFGFLDNAQATGIDYNTNWQWFGETSQGVKQYATQLNEKDIKIMIKPQLWVGGGVYTGFIEMNNEADWVALEASYERFILEFAQVAQEVQADLFCIGTELEKFVIARPSYWTALIAKIKTIYTGKLTYAANWDEYKRVPFWEDVDYIGIDAYFPVSTVKTPTVAEFKTGWAVHKETIQNIQQQFQKPILFTEFGYRSVDFTGEKPWDSSDTTGQVNLVGQSNGLQAIFEEFWQEEWFAGGFIWKWFVNHESAGGENDNRFTPQNKPAETVIKSFYEQ